MHQLSFSAFAAARQAPAHLPPVGVVQKCRIQSVTGRRANRANFESVFLWLDHELEDASGPLDAPDYVPTGGVCTLESSFAIGEFYEYFEAARPGAFQ